MSSRDKKLIFLLLIAAILIGSYMAFDKISAANAEYEQEEKELKDRYADLSAKSSNRAKYQSDTEANNAAYKEIVDSYNTSLRQEQVILFLSLIEKHTGVWLNQMGFSQTNVAYTFGNVTSTNPATMGQRVYQTDYQGLSSQTNLSFECTYDELKTVLLYIKQYGRKYTLDSISFSYAPTSDIVSGTMQVSMFAISGSDRPVDEIQINDVPVGTDNIFHSDTFQSVSADATYYDKMRVDYDLFLIMNQVGSDMSTMAVGMKGDPTGKTTLASESTGIETVEIIVTGTAAGGYKVSYKLGNEVFPGENYAEGSPLVCGDSLDLAITSKPRTGAGDATKVEVTIINNSDKALNYAIYDDDIDDPRVIVKKTEGTVVPIKEQ